ncbi:MAG: hypothetical protein MJH10_20700, partial [Epibacterium sp.]|nr:hypothetical protein [Epibacterium sp.]NQX75886.1 hypothetical protein [Epibacterium sp.]
NESADLTRYLVMSPGNTWQPHGKLMLPKKDAVELGMAARPGEEPGLTPEQMEQERIMSRSKAIAARAARGHKRSRRRGAFSQPI